MRFPGCPRRNWRARLSENSDWRCGGSARLSPVSAHARGNPARDAPDQPDSASRCHASEGCATRGRRLSLRSHPRCRGLRALVEAVTRWCALRESSATPAPLPASAAADQSAEASRAATGHYRREADVLGRLIRVRGPAPAAGRARTSARPIQPRDAPLRCERLRARQLIRRPEQGSRSSVSPRSLSSDLRGCATVGLDYYATSAKAIADLADGLDAGGVADVPSRRRSRRICTSTARVSTYCLRRHTRSMISSRVCTRFGCDMTFATGLPPQLHRVGPVNSWGAAERPTPNSSTK